MFECNCVMCCFAYLLHLFLGNHFMLFLVLLSWSDISCWCDHWYCGSRYLSVPVSSWLSGFRTITSAVDTIESLLACICAIFCAPVQGCQSLVVVVSSSFSLFSSPSVGCWELWSYFESCLEPWSSTYWWSCAHYSGWSGHWLVTVLYHHPLNSWSIG